MGFNQIWMALKRLQKELADFREKAPDGFAAMPVEGDMFKWRVSIPGPAGSPYAAGLFELEFAFPSDYPFKTVKYNFITKVLHPRVPLESGSIDWTGLDGILDRDEWSPKHFVIDIAIALSRDLLGEDA